MLTKSKENRIFKEAVNGYGFTEVEQTVDGIFCTGCLTYHKRPNKMYSNGRDTMCSTQIVIHYNPEES